MQKPNSRQILKTALIFLIPVYFLIFIIFVACGKFEKHMY
jgi:hypothetical protein